VTDTINNIRTEYFINHEVVDLYVNAFQPFQGQEVDVLYSPYSGLRTYVKISPDLDTLDFTSSINNPDFLSTDYVLLRNRYCYEQITPLDFSIIKRKKIMIEDLNRFFSQQYGATAMLTKLKIPCYILVRTSTVDKLTGKDNKSGYPQVSRVVERGKTFKKYESYPLSFAFRTIISENQEIAQSLLQHMRVNKPFLIVNGTGWNLNTKLNLKLPVSRLRSVDELNDSLQQFDISIIVEERQITFLEIKKTRSDAH
jgi:hypothetical protein